MKVSVLMMAYKHGNFVEQAVRSVLEQETSFDFEVLVGEDHSNDGTREILTELQRKNPGRIRLFLNEKNIGMHKNFQQLLESARGEYIAILEGDDYWTSTKKLRKQVDFLDEHSGFSICFHNALKINEENGQPLTNYCPDDQKEVSGFDDLIKGNFVPTCSIVYRKELLHQIPAWTEELPMLDWALLILLGERGKIGYLNEVMGVYRIHAGGIWSTKRHFQKMIGSIQFLTTAKDHLDRAHKEKIEERLADYWMTVSQALCDRVETMPSIEEAINLIENEIRGFPKGVVFPKAVLRKLYANVYASHGFQYFRQKNYLKTRYCWRNAVRNDITWLKNRGVWSIYFRSLLGNSSIR